MLMLQVGLAGVGIGGALEALFNHGICIGQYIDLCEMDV